LLPLRLVTLRSPVLRLVCGLAPVGFLRTFPFWLLRCPVCYLHTFVDSLFRLHAGRCYLHGLVLVRCVDYTVYRLLGLLHVFPGYGCMVLTFYVALRVCFVCLRYVRVVTFVSFRLPFTVYVVFTRFTALLFLCLFPFFTPLRSHHVGCHTVPFTVLRLRYVSVRSRVAWFPVYVYSFGSRAFTFLAHVTVTHSVCVYVFLRLHGVCPHGLRLLQFTFWLYVRSARSFILRCWLLHCCCTLQVGFAVVLFYTHFAFALLRLRLLPLVVVGLPLVYHGLTFTICFALRLDCYTVCYGYGYILQFGYGSRFLSGFLGSSDSPLRSRCYVTLHAFCFTVWLVYVRYCYVHTLRFHATRLRSGFRLVRYVRYVPAFLHFVVGVTVYVSVVAPRWTFTVHSPVTLLVTLRTFSVVTLRFTHVQLLRSLIYILRVSRLLRCVFFIVGWFVGWFGLVTFLLVVYYTLVLYR